MSGALVIGGGPEGLAAATALARAGLKTVLLEPGDDLRGAAAPLEVGSLHFPGALGASAPRPFAARELGLEALPRRADGDTFAPDPEGGAGLLLGSDVERSALELDRARAGDGAAYRTWSGEQQRLEATLAGLFDQPPPDPDAAGARELLPLLGTGLALRRHGARATLEAARLATLSLQDHLEERFASPHARAALAADGLEGVGLGPRAAGTTIAWLANRALRGAELAGGASALADAALQAARAAGAELRAGVAPETLLVEDGAVRGLRLADGESIEAELVLVALSPRRALLELVPPRSLPADVVRSASLLRDRGTTSLVLVAARGPVRARARAGLEPARVLLARDLAQLERAADACQDGRIAAEPWIDCALHVTSGRSVLCAKVHGTPYALQGGWGREERDGLARRALELLGAHLEGLEDPEAVRALAPPDLERELGLTGGHLRQADLVLDQMLFLRPMRACAGYRTPLRGLYLCGPGTHPGGTQPTSSGLLAARVALRDRRTQG